MKRYIALALAMILLAGLCACKKEEAAPATAATTEATTAPTTEPTTAPTEPPSEPGVIRADGVGLVWCTYQRGDTVTVIGKWGGYYVVQDPERDHLVEAQFLRLAGEEPAESYEGWSRHNTQVFASGLLQGEPIATLPQNTKLQIVDSKGGWVFIQWEEGSGYVSADQVSKRRITSGGSGGGGGGGGSGTQDGSDVDLGSLSVVNPEDYRINLLGAYSGPVYEELAPCEGTILSDGSDGYWAILSRDDTVKVTESTEETCTLYVGDAFVQVPRWIVRLGQDEEYTSWEAYSRWATKAYSTYQLTTEVQTFRTNQKVEVVDELVELGLYVVRLENGFGYVAKAGLGQYPVSSGGGDSGSGGGGGGGGGEWTPPAL